MESSTRYADKPCERCGGKMKLVYDDGGMLYPKCMDVECMDKKWEEDWDSRRKVSEKVGLWPEWKGGKGLGILCPMCLGNQYIPHPKDAYSAICLMDKVFEDSHSTIILERGKKYILGPEDNGSRVLYLSHWPTVPSDWFGGFTKAGSEDIRRIQE